MRTWSPRNAASVAGIVASVFLVSWFYHWTIATSGGFNPPGEEDYYNFQVRGWRQGHLHMSKEPSPAMLALPDPYDPERNRDIRLADASFYRGHYYLYFGAAPAALLMLPYDLLTGREMGTTTAIYVFCIAGFLAATALWLALRRRHFPECSPWVEPLGILALGLGTHVLALERRPLVWELPISMGYAFSMLALLGVYAALHTRRPVAAMGAAGLCLGLAVAARPTCLLGALIFLPALWAMARQPGLGGRAARCAAAAACGLGACLLAVLAHNYARFGNALEFGQNYQLSGVYESKVRHFSLTYVPHNTYLYYFHPGHWEWTFPFVAVAPVTGGPPGYLGNWSEAVCGLAVTFPFVWLVLALPLAWSGPAGDWRLRAMIGSVVAFFLAMSLAILAYFLATERYMADFAPSLGLLALLGWLGLCRWAGRRGWSGAAVAAGSVACIVTSISGVIVSLDYHGGALRALRPDVWNELQRFFSAH